MTPTFCHDMSFIKTLPLLPSELVLGVVEFMPHGKDVNSLARTCRRLWHLVNPKLYGLFGSASLNWAARNARVDSARRARGYNVNVNYMDDNGRTPLLIALSLENCLLADFFLNYPGIDVNCKAVPKDSANFNGATPLTVAVEMQMYSAAERLIYLGADVNAKDEQGRTALWHAANNDACGLANFLLKRLAIDVDCSDVNGSTPLIIAAGRGHHSVLRVLLESARVDANAVDSNGRTSLWWAAHNNHVETIQLLLAFGGVKLNLGDKFGLTPLSAAVRSQNREAVKALLTI